MVASELQKGRLDLGPRTVPVCALWYGELGVPYNRQGQRMIVPEKFPEHSLKL